MVSNLLGHTMFSTFSFVPKLMAAMIILVIQVIPRSSEAQDRGDQPTKVDLSASGGYLAGNIRQAQVQGRVHLSRSTADSGFDLIGSVFRFWVRPEPGDAFIEVGNTQSLIALPFLYLGKRPYVLGIARVEHTGLRLLDSRINAGAAFGIAPIREEDRLLRIAIGGQFERTKFNSNSLAPNWVPDEAIRVSPRVAMTGNGWYRPKGSPVGGYFVGSLMVNPVEVRDLRGVLDLGVDFHLTQTLSIRTSIAVTHETVVHDGIEPTDLRSMVGLSWKAPKPAASQNAES